MREYTQEESSVNQEIFVEKDTYVLMQGVQKIHFMPLGTAGEDVVTITIP